jgi:uncharacterized phage protein (TIGR01671 family)
MTRGIRFRQPIWMNGKFAYWHYWGFHKKGEFTAPCYSPEQAEKESQEFTGLKDKNGKEIFEGDVVAIMGSDCSKCPSKDENGDCALVDESCPVVEKYRDVVTMERFPIYWLKNESFGYEGEDLQSPDECEVIGNIYKNPELITEASTQPPDEV